MPARSASKNKHPGHTPAQRRVLDAIGCGNHSPWMTKRTRERLINLGLIVHVGDRYVGDRPFRVAIAEFDMPIAVHMAWCEAMAEEPEPKGGDAP